MATAGNISGKQSARVCVGEIGAARGLSGEFCVRSFTADPRAIASYGPLATDPADRCLRLSVVGEKKNVLIVRAEGIADRSAAEALRGLRLYVDRTVLPAPDEDEYYHADLVGLAVELAGGPAGDAGGRDVPPHGQVLAVHDFGAGPILEVKAEGTATVLIPFTRTAVPEVDLAGGRIVVAALPGLFQAEDDAGDADDAAVAQGGGEGLPA